MMPVADFVFLASLAVLAWVSGYIAGLPFAWVRRIQSAA